mgnify:CR=1 FL=1
MKPSLINREDFLNTKKIVIKQKPLKSPSPLKKSKPLTIYNNSSHSNPLFNILGITILAIGGYVIHLRYITKGERSKKYEKDVIQLVSEINR